MYCLVCYCFLLSPEITLQKKLNLHVVDRDRIDEISLVFIYYLNVLHMLIIKKLHVESIPQGCEITRDNHGEPLATSYHSKFMGTVDYIWYVY